MTPSSIAAFVALTASSIFNLRYFISVSVAAPTRITATPPASLAIRLSNFSISYFDFSNSLCFFNWEILLSISDFLPLPPTMIVLSLVEIILLDLPKIFISALSSFILPTSSVTNFAPTVIAISSNCFLFSSP